MMLSEPLLAEVTSLIIERLGSYETLCELFVQQVEERMNASASCVSVRTKLNQLTEKIGWFEGDLRYAKTMLASVSLAAT